MFRAAYSHPWAFLECRFGPGLARGPIRCVITEQVPELSMAAQSRMQWCLSVSNTCSLYPLSDNPLTDRDYMLLSFYFQVLSSAPKVTGAQSVFAG